MLSSPHLNGKSYFVNSRSLDNIRSYNDEVDEENLFSATRMDLDTTSGSGGGRGIIRDMVNAATPQPSSSSIKNLEKRKKGDYNMGVGGEGRSSKKLFIMVVTLSAASLLFGVLFFHPEPQPYF